MAKGKNFKPKTKKKLNKKEQQHLLNIYEDDFETSKGKNLRQHNLDQMSGGVDQYHVDHINSEDDEEIDSDDAFGENEMDDQYNAMVLGLKDRKREAKLNRIAKGKGDVSDDSDDERFDKEIILEEGEAFIDLSTLLDDQTLVATEEDYLDSKPKKVKYQDLIGDADMQDDEDDFNLMDSGDEDDEDEDDDQMPSDYDDDDEPSNLTKFITGLDSDQNKKKLFLNDPTSNRKESEFNFGASAYDDDNSGKLDLKSLLQPLENESGFDHLQNKVQDLMHTSKSQMSTLKAPKVKRLQDKIVRTAAYEESKEQISQWETIIKENREKEHLSFTQTDSQAVQPKSTNVLANHTKVENDMEREIYEALQSHNIQDKNLKNFEDLQSQALSAQELKDRQKKMMQLRNLMFKEELKAKRVSKIKSKAYRKVLRKEKAKLAKLQGEVDGGDDMEDSDEEATKNEIARARERMSLKHQNTTKWAKNLMKHGGRESESHQAITEQLQEHERLKQKIIGKSGEDEESEDDYDELDNGTIDTSDKKQVINFAFNELNKIIDDEEDEKPAKGIMGMKFMQKALERQKKETEELAQQAQEDLRLLNRDSDEDYTHGQSGSEDEDDTKHRKVVQGNEGRLQFTGVGANAEEQDNLPIPTKKDKKKNNNKSVKAPKLQVTKNGVYSKTADEDDNFGEESKLAKASNEEEESNPWLSHQDDLPLAGIKSKKNQGGQLSQTEKASLKLSKAKSSAKDKEETNLSKVKVNASQTLSNIIYPEDENKEDGDDKEPTVVHSSKLTSFNQRELVELAFANDDVVQEFEQEKQQVIESQTAKDEDITLPGWGSWGGENRKPKKRLFKQAKPGSGIDQEKRKDRKLNHVIINEVHNPKLEKYTVRGVPSQYRSQEEFEQTMRGAIGKEWNPTTTYHKAIKPKVLVTKVGKVIDPIKAPFKP